MRIRIRPDRRSRPRSIPHNEAQILEDIGDFIARQVLDKDAVFFDG
jgi:hypothetical protein